MNKRILSILLCLLLVASVLVLAVPVGATPTESMELKVVADKESAKAGDTVAFQIVMGPVTEVGSIVMTVDIPAGLTYVAGSGKVADGVMSAMDFDMLSWTEDALMINGSASKADYASTTDTVLGSFECTVDDGATGTLSVGLDEIEMGSCQPPEFEIFTELFTVTKANVTIEGDTPADPTAAPEEPTAAPEEPTAAPEEPTVAPEEPTVAPEPVHEHHLTFVEEVPATTEADGIKAHYVCDGENGCGKFFDDAFATVELTEADLVIPKIVPVDPTAAPEEPTAAPEEPTAAPEEPTAAPEEPTAAPEEPTAAPEEPTAAPEEPTAAPEEPTAAPEEPTAAPEEPTAAPEEPTVAPEEPTAAPEEPTVAPEEPTVEPEPTHEHELTFVEEVPATTEADGIKAHYVCAGCGKIFEDAFGTVELTEADLVIPKIVPVDPTEEPVVDPTEEPVVDPTDAPVVEPTEASTEAPTVEPTKAPATRDETPATRDKATKDEKATKDSGSGSGSSPKTGDSTNMYLWMMIMLASMVGVGAVLYTAKRKGIFTK